MRFLQIIPQMLKRQYSMGASVLTSGYLSCLMHSATTSSCLFCSVEGELYLKGAGD